MDRHRLHSVFRLLDAFRLTVTYLKVRLAPSFAERPGVTPWGCVSCSGAVHRKLLVNLLQLQRAFFFTLWPQWRFEQPSSNQTRCLVF